MNLLETKPLIRKIDSIEVRVPDLEAGLGFYRDKLGHELVWRNETAAGLRMSDTDAEIVMQTERPPETALLVTSVEDAVSRVVAAGGKMVAEPHDIQIGRCGVVEDPWGNRLVLLDMSKGRLLTDANGRIVGNEPPS